MSIAKNKTIILFIAAAMFYYFSGMSVLLDTYIVRIIPSDINPILNVVLISIIFSFILFPVQSRFFRIIQLMNQMNRDYQKEVKDKDFNIEEFRKKYKMINKHTILALLICQVVLFGLGLKVVKHVDITLPLLAVIGIYLAFYLVLFFSFKNMMIKGIKENYLRHGIFLIMGIAFTLIVLDIPEMIFIMVLLIPYVYKS